jgi:2-dehydro-3-deoxy-D-arabinonate dehydratase
MYLTRHQTSQGSRLALDGKFLTSEINLNTVLALSKQALAGFLSEKQTAEPAEGTLLPPLENDQEVWASGVTYLRSRDARKAESEVADVYQRVYEAERPELFFKAVGWRVSGNAMPVRLRKDSTWNVPEPELVLVINQQQEIVGFTAGNDVSSRSIEGENPLYLPQAKTYNGSCALGAGIKLIEAENLQNLPINLTISRQGETVFQGETDTAQMKRKVEELVAYLCRELSFPHGVFLMTGTGIVPPDDFSLQNGDEVQIVVGELNLTNQVVI